MVVGSTAMKETRSLSSLGVKERESVLGEFIEGFIN